MPCPTAIDGLVETRLLRGLAMGRRLTTSHVLAWSVLAGGRRPAMGERKQLGSLLVR